AFGGGAETLLHAFVGLHLGHSNDDPRAGFQWVESTMVTGFLEQRKGSNYLGTIVQTIRLPCCDGGDSGFPESSSNCRTRLIMRCPSSMWASSRPRKTTETITLSL